MWRASILFLLVAAATASAAPRPWSLDIPAGSTDITADMLQAPPVAAARGQIVKSGGTFDAVAYQTPDGLGLFIVTSDNDSLSTMDAWTNFANSARKAATKTSKELSYREERGPKVITITQRFDTGDVQAVSRRIDGFLRSGTLRTISVNCYGEPALCDSLINKVTVDESVYKPLAKVASGSSASLKELGLLVGAIVLVLGVVGVVWNRRHATT